MTQADAARARVDGRESVARRTVWQLEVGALRMRCVCMGGDVYRLEARDGSGRWQLMTTVGSAFGQLRRVLDMDALKTALSDAIEKARTP